MQYIHHHSALEESMMSWKEDLIYLSSVKINDTRNTLLDVLIFVYSKFFPEYSTLLLLVSS